MNYRHIYMIIITKAKEEMRLGLRKKENGNYYEKHHILPKSLFPLWTKRKSNLVLLTAREHFFCHQLLTKIFPSRQMNFALWSFLTKNDKKQNGLKLSSKDFEVLRSLDKSKSQETKDKISKANKGKKRSEACVIKMKEYQKSHPLSNEMRQKIGEASRNANLGKTVSDETRQKMSNAKKGISFSESHKNSLKEACKKKNYSEIFNEDVRKKLSDAKKGKAPNNSKAVFTSNGLEFESTAACERFFKIDRRKIEKAIEKQISINGIFFSRNKENA